MPFDDVSSLRLQRVVGLILPHDLQGGEDGGEWVSQFVAEHRQELILPLVHPCQFFGHFAMALLGLAQGVLRQLLLGEVTQDLGVTPEDAIA